MLFSIRMLRAPGYARGLLRMNLRWLPRVMCVMAGLFGSLDALAAPCPLNFVLDQAIVAAPCTIEGLTFSQFSFTTVQGDSPIGSGHILVTVQAGSPSLFFSSTPLIFAPAGMTVQRGIGFVVSAPPDRKITSVTIETMGGIIAGTPRPPVRTYVCLGAAAVMGSNGTVTCSGDLVTVDSQLLGTQTLNFPAAMTVGVVNDIYIQAFAGTFGELNGLRNAIGTTGGSVPPPTEIPASAPLGIVVLAIAVSLIGLRAMGLRRHSASIADRN